jgi:subtilisin-like proprotein convertase family protein
MKEITVQEANELLKVEGDEYKYNENAVTFFEVKAVSHYITESNPSTSPFTDTISTYTRQDHYHYILELDADGKVNGGEWVGASNVSHPDFLWLPTAARSGNPDIDMSSVRLLLEKSIAPIVDTPEPDTAELNTYENNFEFEIPDNDTNGVSSTIDVHDEFTVGRVELEVEIEHTYIGDLKVTLRKDGQEQTVHDRSGGSNANIKKTFTVSGLNGAAAAGTWELVITDHADQDIGTLKNWTLKLRTQSSTDAVSTEGTFTVDSTESVSIPDNNETGAVSKINVTESKSIARMTIKVKVSHSYIGALVLSVKHGAVTKTIHNMEGGDDTSIEKTYIIEEFNGDNTSGDWELKAVDTDAYNDTGSIESWSIEFTY